MITSGMPIYKVFVPLILWSSFVWASNTGPLVGYDEDSLWSKTPFEPNLAFFAALFYVCYYLLLEPIAGLIYAPIILGMAYNATEFMKTYPGHNYLAGIVHVGSWIVQFIGHGVFEKRSPALKDNIAQALLLAPLFVWLEVLFATGYRPALQKRVEAKVNTAITKFKAGQKKAGQKKAD
ncbi:5474_t:CDS:2 [Paraglomus brasilianum]|uniref:5474_t:CDS:1 n=1 Tax=Paraglomus brasilianum TaxID=144538 RepID=A0A9N9EZF8_9GLOM|nr:5474_t:CDS:2 [Paraglomus brasilianum]